MYRTYFDADGGCLGSYAGFDESNPLFGNASAEGQYPMDARLVDGVVVEPTEAERAEVINTTRAQLTDDLLRALALVLLDEVNVLRTRASLAPRTIDQLRAAIKARL